MQSVDFLVSINIKDTYSICTSPFVLFIRGFFGLQQGISIISLWPYHSVWTPPLGSSRRVKGVPILGYLAQPAAIGKCITTEQ